MSGGKRGVYLRELDEVTRKTQWAVTVKPVLHEDEHNDKRVRGLSDDAADSVVVAVVVDVVGGGGRSGCSGGGGATCCYRCCRCCCRSLLTLLALIRCCHVLQVRSEVLIFIPPSQWSVFCRGQKRVRKGGGYLFHVANVANHSVSHTHSEKHSEDWRRGSILFLTMLFSHHGVTSESAYACWNQPVFTRVSVFPGW